MLQWPPSMIIALKCKNIQSKYSTPNFWRMFEIFLTLLKALDKREYLIIIRIIFVNSASKHVVTPHLNHLDEMVQMRGHNIWFG